ncbi:MAG: mRNA interferase RelE/StbE [Phenylobacterium sp.]|jgi:mRNA interferase RelE/StbE
MYYEILIERSAQKSLVKIPKSEQLKIIQSIESLSDNPRPHGSKKLSGRDGWRIRIGNYRVIYEIQNNQLIVLVLSIGDRKEIYKNKK